MSFTQVMRSLALVSRGRYFFALYPHRHDASGDASFIHGAVLDVDGGRTEVAAIAS